MYMVRAVENLAATTEIYGNFIPHLMWPDMTSTSVICFLHHW